MNRHQAKASGCVSFLAPTSPESVVVDETPKGVLDANNQRVGSSWVNASSSDIYLGLGVEARVGAGIYLVAKGGSWDGRISGLVWDGSVSAVAVVGSDNFLCVVEV